MATYAETAIVQLDAATYSSERGGERRHGGTLLQDLEVAGMVLSMMDDRHARIRRLVSAGLTPRTVGRLEDELRRRTIALLDAIDDDVPFDFVTEVASELPMQAICILLGVPEDDRHQLGAFFDAGFDIREGDVGFADSGPATNGVATAGLAMLDYCVALVAAKRAAPTDDMLSVVVHASLPDVEPAQLSDVELYSFFSLLFAAGAQTTSRDRRWRARAARISRPTRGLARRPRSPRYCDRGDVAVDDAVAGEAAHRRAAGDPRRPCRHPGREGAVLGGVGEPRRAGLRSPDDVRHPPRSQSPSRSVAVCTTASAPTSPASRCGWCSRSCSIASPASSRPATSSGPAATATRASATCPC